MTKICDEKIANCNENIFGNWITKNITLNEIPFKHCIIDNFLNEEIYQIIYNTFPEKPDNNFHKYLNPIEVKYAIDDFKYIDNEIVNFFLALSSDKLINKFENLFNIEDLEYDPHLHGAGVHMHPRNGRLNMHLDYEKHPLMNKQRRLNIIYYVNKEWKTEWNGDTQLWDQNMQNCIVKSYPEKNRAIIFETTELSWHGVPEKIMCPENIYRKTLAYYYISPMVNKRDNKKTGANSEGFRTKATFIKRPQDKYDERMEKLYKIRPQRRITEEDMKEIFPDWNVLT